MITISCLLPNRSSSKAVIPKMVFVDRFQLILMSFLTTFLHKNSQNDVKILESWWIWHWIWHILGKGTHIYSNQKQPDFHQKSPWTPMPHLSPVCTNRHIVKFSLTKHRPFIGNEKVLSQVLKSNKYFYKQFISCKKKKKIYEIKIFWSWPIYVLDQ